MPGSFTKTVVSTAASDPVHSRYFRSHADGCDACATFNGDYVGLDYASDGTAHMAWTDMRVPSDEEGFFYQYVWYAKK
jgi:hypothetical protein